MKRYKYSFILIILMVSISVSSIAQDSTDTKKSPFSFNTDVVTSYVWRGSMISNMPNLQPYFTFTKGGFEAGSWGSISTIGDFSEIDLFASYTLGSFSLLATDYYVLSDYPDANYFNYADLSTGHTVEGCLSFEGPEKFPITILASTFVYGDDKDTTENNYYSSYFEAGYSFSNFDIFIGFTPWEGLYGDGAGVVNAGMKLNNEIKISKNYSIPAFISLSANPRNEKLFLTAGFTF